MKTNLKEGVETREDFWPAGAEQAVERTWHQAPGSA